MSPLSSPSRINAEKTFILSTAEVYNITATSPSLKRIGEYAFGRLSRMVVSLYKYTRTMRKTVENR